jgi:NADH-quinone oxidoreductase subunit M
MSYRLIAGVWLTASAALFSPQPVIAYAATALCTALLAIAGWSLTRHGATMLVISAIATGAAAAGLVQEGTATLAWALSLVAIALRAGVAGAHSGVVSLCRDALAHQVLQYATLLVLVFIHLRFADHVTPASDLAPALVRYGAASALGFALIALTHRTLEGFLEASTLMHGGVLFAAIGAAGRGHHSAAMFVIITMTLALGGLTLMMLSLQQRVGDLDLATNHGLGRRLPRLAAGFAFFAAAGVGMPGTAGFVADDLLLHALWEESVFATVAVVIAAGLLAIATLRVIARVFFGRRTDVVAPDLLPAERWSTVSLVTLLLFIGLLPAILTRATTALLGVR